jgi:hypothetical protein
MDGLLLPFEGKQLSTYHVQSLLFCKPVSVLTSTSEVHCNNLRLNAISLSQTLLEYAVAGQNLERLGTIEVSFNRGVISNIRPMGANNLGGMGATHNADLVGPIGEKARKQKMIGAVTK